MRPPRIDPYSNRPWDYLRVMVRCVPIFTLEREAVLLRTLSWSSLDTRSRGMAACVQVQVSQLRDPQYSTRSLSLAYRQMRRRWCPFAGQDIGSKVKAESKTDCGIGHCPKLLRALGRDLLTPCITVYSRVLAYYCTIRHLSDT